MPNQLDTKLHQLREAAQRIGQNLVDLELDSGRRLLEASTLVGESAASWSAASAMLTELWQWHGLLDEFVQRAQSLRDGRRFDELRSLLEDPSIELSSSELPLADRNLLESSIVTERCTPDQLLARMSHAFGEVTTVVAAIGGAWEKLAPGLDAAGRLLADCARLAEELGERDHGEVESAGLQLSSLRALLSTDPMSLAASEIELLNKSLEKLHQDLSGAAALMRELDGRIAAAGELAARIRDALGEVQAAHAELVIKISVPAAPEAPPMPEQLDAELLEIRTLAGRGQWREARGRLDRLTARAEAELEEARRVLAANRAPIVARNQFRALLDAYQVKAKRLGMVEDPELAEVYAQARNALYNAPTDLSRVGQLVRRYQETLDGTSSKREARR